MANLEQALDFLTTDLQNAIMQASAQAKSVLCFIGDESEQSMAWEAAIRDDRLRERITNKSVTLRINPNTQEAEFLKHVAPTTGVPAMVLFERGTVQEVLQSPAQTVEEVADKLQELYEGSDNSVLTNAEYNNMSENPTIKSDAYIVLTNSNGRMRLPNNAYDALTAQTLKWVQQGIRGDNVLSLQLRILDKVPGMSAEVSRLRLRPTGELPRLSTAAEEQLLNTPAHALRLPGTSTNTSSEGSSTTAPARNGSASSGSARSTIVDRSSSSRNATTAESNTTASVADTGRPASNASSAQAAPTGQLPIQRQQTDYALQQREREAASRAERQRIKEQIASDRAERRRQDELRRQSDRRAELEQLRQANSTLRDPQASDIRIQVRTFDGRTIRNTFTKDATITKEVRPWIDFQTVQSIPYNLKLILTPLPNRNIEASEEERMLPDLGVVGSATMVMVPVKGYVDSYAGQGGIVGSITGALTSAFGGIGNLIGWGAEVEAENGAEAGHAAHEQQSKSTANTAQSPPSTTSTSRSSNVKVRTLADQRADEAKKQGNEFYNGNQLSFQGRKDDNGSGSGRKDD